MTIKGGIVFLILAVLVALGGWYIFINSQALPHTLNSQGDRQIKEDTDFYTIQAVYPNSSKLASRTDSSASADEKAIQTIESYVIGTVATFKNNANSALTSDEKARLTEQKLKYSLGIAYQQYTSSSFASVELDVAEDTGGAHPINSYKTFVFDLKGDQVALSDLFTPGSDYLGRISEAATKQIGEQLVAEGADASSSIIAEGVAPTADNFSNWVDKDGLLVFLIPPYQAAAYAAGSFEVHIPMSDLSDILKPGIQ